MDITHQLLDGELLRASHTLAAKPISECHASDWKITVMKNGQLIGHRNLILIPDPWVWLTDPEQALLTNELEKLDVDYDNETIIRREFNKDGKSRVFVNDSPVVLASLREIMHRLLDVHSKRLW